MQNVSKIQIQPEFWKIDTKCNWIFVDRNLQCVLTRIQQLLSKIQIELCVSSRAAVLDKVCLRETFYLAIKG